MVDFFVSLVVKSNEPAQPRSRVELVNIKNQIMEKCDKDHSGTLSLREMAFVHEELLVCSLVYTVFYILVVFTLLFTIENDEVLEDGGAVQGPGEESYRRNI